MERFQAISFTACSGVSLLGLKTDWLYQTQCLRNEPVKIRPLVEICWNSLSGAFSGYLIYSLFGSFIAGVENGLIIPNTMPQEWTSQNSASRRNLLKFIKWSVFRLSHLQLVREFHCWGWKRIDYTEHNASGMNQSKFGLSSKFVKNSASRRNLLKFGLSPKFAEIH